MRGWKRTLVIAKNEFAGAMRNPWLIGFAVTFAATAAGLAWLSVADLPGAGSASYDRTVTGLVSLVLLAVPLVGLMLGSQAIAVERERGSLLMLMAQPVEASEVMIGKIAGQTAGIAVAVLAGFGAAASLLAARGSGGGVAGYLGFVGLTVLLAAVTVGLGMWIAVPARSAATATAGAMMLWLVLVILGDLGLMGTAVALRLDGSQLLFLAAANPLQVFRLATLAAVGAGGDVLGPTGLYAAVALRGAVLPIGVGLLAGWCVLAALSAAHWLRARGALS